MSFYHITKVRKSRTTRRCDWCGQSIPIGAASIKSCGTNSGDFWTWYQHPECWHAQQHVTMGDDGGYEQHAWGRGRTDDKNKLPPEFNPDGWRSAL